MTGEKIIDFANYLVGETIFDKTSADDLIFLNIQKDNIERDVEWEWLKKQDRSKSTTVGNSYLNGYDLPSDFLIPLSKNALYVDIVPYEQIPLGDNELYKNTGQKWYIDYTANKFYITDGTTISGTITLNYVKKTDDITATSSPVWLKGHELISYDMAIEYLDGIDYDPINTAKADRLIVKRNMIYDGMINFNSKLALTSMNSQMGNNVEVVEADNKVDIYNY